MKLHQALLDHLPDGRIVQVRVGINWTAVVAETDAGLRCGLSSTLEGQHDHSGEPPVPDAGRLESWPARELAALALRTSYPLASIGVAAINALLPEPPRPWNTDNAETLIFDRGVGKNVAVIGRFPFSARLKEKLGSLTTLEQQPGPDDLPAQAAPVVLPHMDVVAITGMAFLNHTLENLLALCSPQAKVLLIGPSAPLAPLLFAAGIDVIASCVVTNIENVLHSISQGATFRQVHQAGVELVNIFNPHSPPAQ